METTSLQKTKVNRISVITYYLLACAFSWPFFWWRDMNPESWQHWRIPNILKTYSYMWGPGIAAIICFILFRKTHRRTVSFFGSSIVRSLAFYLLPLFALAVPGIKGQGLNPHIVPLLFGTLGFISILGEELGWRGYLQDALRPLKKINRYLLIGVMWEIWHFTNRMGHGHFQQIVLRVLIMMCATIVLSFIIGEAVDKTKSIVVAVTLHAWIDILGEFSSTGTWIVFGLAIPFWVYMILSWNKEKDVVKLQLE